MSGGSVDPVWNNELIRDISDCLLFDDRISTTCASRIGQNSCNGNTYRVHTPIRSYKRTRTNSHVVNTTIITPVGALVTVYFGDLVSEYARTESHKWQLWPNIFAPHTTYSLYRGNIPVDYIVGMDVRPDNFGAHHGIYSTTREKAHSGYVSVPYNYRDAELKK